MLMELNKSSLLAAGAGIAALVAMYLYSAPAAKAADLGGGCCADLEERIAELETTVARKGNRKVNLTVQGQVNTALLYVDIEDYSNTTVVQNGNDESYVGFYVNARINGDMSAGATLEIEARELGLLALPVGGIEVMTRQSNVWIKSETLGKLTVGKAAIATRGFDEISTANTAIAAKPLSLGALSDAYLTGIDIPFDGTYRDVVRYDSAKFGGFALSATWGNSVDITKPDGDGDTYDVALRFNDEAAGFKIAAGLGYRQSTDLDINLLGITTLSLPTGDVKTVLATGSIMHLGTGLFLTGNYADQQWDAFGGFDLTGYALTGGIERKWFSVGATTLYGEWNQISVDSSGSDGEIDMYGAGVVQTLDAAAMDLYVSYRNYDLGDLGGDDLIAATAGARIKF